jgi:hypothetical protein
LTTSRLAKAAADYDRNGYAPEEADVLATSLRNTDTTAVANPSGFASNSPALASAM